MKIKTHIDIVRDLLFGHHCVCAGRQREIRQCRKMPAGAGAPAACRRAERRTGNTIRRLAVAAAAALLGAPAVAADPSGPGLWYVAGAVGAGIPGDAKGNDANGWLETELGSGASVNAAIGYRLGRLRIEGALSWARMDIDSWANRNGKARTAGKEFVLGVMANVWYDIDLGTALMPFVGGGLGAARVGGQLEEVNGVPGYYESEHNWVLAWQVGAGVSYEIGERTAVQFGWRHLDPGSAKGDTVKWDIEGIYILEIGLRVGF